MKARTREEEERASKVISFKQFLLRESKLCESLEQQFPRLKRLAQRCMHVFTACMIEDKTLMVVRGRCDRTEIDLEMRVVDGEVNRGLPDFEEFDVLEVKAYKVLKEWHAYKRDRKLVGEVSLNLDEASDETVIHAIKDAMKGAWDIR